VNFRLCISLCISYGLTPYSEKQHVSFRLRWSNVSVWHQAVLYCLADTHHLILEHHRLLVAQLALVLRIPIVDFPGRAMMQLPMILLEKSECIRNRQLLLGQEKGSPNMLLPFNSSSLDFGPLLLFFAEPEIILIRP